MPDKTLVEINCSNQSMEDVQVISFLDGTTAYFAHQCPGVDRDNQDSLGITARDETSGILIVADGIGGHRAGDQASKIAVTTVIKEFSKEKNTSLRESVFNGINLSNQQIRNLGVGAGTTIVVALVENKEVTFFTIGDSKGYVFSGQGNIKFQTLEQSSAGLALASDLFSEKEIKPKPGKNHLIYCLGEETLNICINGPISLSARDSILLCSDGMTANLSQEEIAQIIGQGQVVDRATNLVQTAQKKMVENSSDGHPDDLSVVLFNLGRQDEVSNNELEKPLEK